MTRAFLGLGSNLGDRVSYLREAVAALESSGEVVAVSPVYETDPVGGPTGQGLYLNLVVELDTALDPRQLLDRCRALEADGDRRRGEHWGPRTLDVDILWVDGVELVEPDLQVPHPRMRERRFVLVPLADLAPELVAPGEIAAAAGAVQLVGALADVAPRPTGSGDDAR